MVDETSSTRPFAGGKTDDIVPGDAVTTAVVETTMELEAQYDEGVPYERVVQLVSREKGVKRSQVEAAVESLSEGGHLSKPRADYLRTN